MEMDAKGMSFDPSWTLRLAGFFALGALGGALYFYAVWRSALALARGGGASKTFIFLAGRFALIGAVLAFAAMRGGGPLLAAAAGLLLARAATMRRLKEAAR